MCTDIAVSRKFYEEILGAKFIAKFDPPGLLFFKDPADHTLALVEQRTL